VAAINTSIAAVARKSEMVAESSEEQREPFAILARQAIIALANGISIASRVCDR
jgi:hypothetical protein